MASLSSMRAFRPASNDGHRTALDGFAGLAGVDLGCLYRDHRGLLLAVVQACRYPMGYRDSQRLYPLGYSFLVLASQRGPARPAGECSPAHQSYTPRGITDFSTTV